MPAAADNPTGYWESRPIVLFNNRLLASAGTCWNDDAALARGWFDDRARAADRAEARTLLAQEFGDAPSFVLKDPRLCRLAPFWRRVLDESAICAHALLIVRDPMAVARSLAARAHSDASRPAAVVSPARALLLWFRYVLEAELHARGLARARLAFEDLLADWRGALGAAMTQARLPLAPMTERAEAAIDAFLQPALARQSQPEADPVRPETQDEEDRRLLAQSLYRRLVSASDEDDVAASCRAMAEALDRLSAACRPLRLPVAPSGATDVWGEFALHTLASLERAGPAPRLHTPARPPSVLFLSGAPASVGHVYRVQRAVAALTESGWRARWQPLDPAALPDLPDGADQPRMVVLFRVRWSPALACFRSTCLQRGIRLVFDIDDLVFSPALMQAGHFAYLERLPHAVQQRWHDHAALYAKALQMCDAAVLTTAPLAAAAAALCPRAVVLENGLGPDTLAEADRVPARAVAGGERLRFGFASGTPTHQRDFATIVEPLVRLFDRRPEAVLTVLGELDLEPFPQLLPHAHRIERRPRVPFDGLLDEVARFDVNLAPLEVGNPFCESKSAVRCLTAAALRIPTLGAATHPLAQAIVPFETGLLARDAADWDAGLDRLCVDHELRRRLGTNARFHVAASAGWEIYRDRAARTFAGLLRATPPGRDSAPGVPRAGVDAGFGNSP